MTNLMDLMLRRPRPAETTVTWATMGRAERAHAFLLMLARGWYVDLTERAFYDPNGGRVLVEYERMGTATWAFLRPLDETLREIDTRFGPEARRRAEEIIDG